MTKLSLGLGLLGAAALLSSLLASPVMAQQVISEPGYCAQFYPNANCDNLGPGNPYTGNYQSQSATNNSYNSYNRWDGDGQNYPSRFRHGDYAAAPMDDDAYLSLNGFACRPGTYFRGGDGQRHICQ